MEPVLFTTQTGMRSLRYGGEALEDPIDPELAARQFVRAERLEGIDHVVVFGAGLGYRLRRIAELGCQSPIVFEPCQAALSLAEAHGPGIPSGATIFTDPSALHRHLLQVSKPDQRTILLGAPPYQRAFPAAHQAVVQVIDEVQGLVMLQRNSVMDRAAILSERAVENVRRMARTAPLHRLGKPLAGRPAFLVSAGPSLDKNRHLLKEASRRGAVFAVNTSAPVMGAIGAPIDLLLAIEVLDASEPMKYAADVTRAVAVDITASGANWHPFEVAGRTAFCVEAPQYRRLAQHLGMGTLGYGGSVATAAFAVALELGADPIVLVGQDLAYTDGRGYATDTLFDATTVRREGELLIIERAKKWEDLTKAGGLRIPGRARPRVGVRAWGSGDDHTREVDSTHELTSFRRWFEMASYELSGSTRLINATEGGASIAGFEELSLDCVVSSFAPEPHSLAEALATAEPVASDRVEATTRDIRTCSRALATAAKKAVRALSRGRRSAYASAQAEVSRRAKEAPLAEAHAAPALMRVMDDDSLSPSVRARRTYEAIEASARKIGRLVTTI